jgi:hypothetical protein
MTSPSTVFFGHPKETMETFARRDVSFAALDSLESLVSAPPLGGGGAMLALAAANFVFFGLDERAARPRTARTPRNPEAADIMPYLLEVGEKRAR